MVNRIRTAWDWISDRWSTFWTWLWLGASLAERRRMAEEHVRALGGRVIWSVRDGR